MINYNIILYVGLFLIISGFILFIRFEIKKSRLDRELFRQQRLTESFNRNKSND